MKKTIFAWLEALVDRYHDVCLVFQLIHGQRVQGLSNAAEHLEGDVYRTAVTSFHLFSYDMNVDIS